MLNTNEVKAALDGNNVVVLSVKKEGFRDILIDVAGFLSSRFKRICWVSLSKPFGTVDEMLKKADVDASKFFFIDVLSATVTTPEDADNAVFIDSPNDLTSISIAINEALKVGCDALFIDSLPTLLVYNDVETIIKFSNSVLTRTNVGDKKALIVTLKEDEGSELVKNLYEFSDKVIDASSPGKTIVNNKCYGIDLNKEVTPIMVRDAIIRCFTLAHAETVAKNLDMPEEEKAKFTAESIKAMIKKAFSSAGGDFDAPTKGSILKVMEELKKVAANFRDPSIISKHSAEIMKLVEKLE